MSKTSLTVSIRYMLFICLFSSIVPIRAEANNKVQPKQNEIRNLYGEELQKARQARDNADRLFAEYKRLYPSYGEDLEEEHQARDSADKLSAEYKQPVSRSPQEARDFDEVVLAYEQVIEKFGGTAIAAYCQLRLCEPHKYRGQFVKAIKQAQAVADRFPGTPYEVRAHFVMGNIHLEGFNDAKGAIPYFEKIAKPRTNSTDDVVRQEEYNQNHKMYLSAQKQIAKCEIRLGNNQAAKEIYDHLAQRYPQFKQHFEDVQKFELDSYLQGSFGIDLEKISDDMIQSIPTILETSQPPQTLPKDSTESTSSSSSTDKNVPKLNDKGITKTKKVANLVLNAQNNPSAKAQDCLFSVSRIIMISFIVALVVLCVALRGFKSRKEVDMVKK